MPAVDHLAWRKASYSGDGESCVEVAPAVNNVLVRDTKCRAAGTVSFPHLAWSQLVSTLSG
jgi:hypothetical protein